MPDPHVAPFSGGIQFEWDLKRSLEVSIEEENDFLDYLITYPNGSTSESRIYKKYWKDINSSIKFVKGRKNEQKHS